MAQTALAELLARWDSGDGKPYKGALIDWEAYSADPENLGCMCAQGQALHVIGGWSAEKLHSVAQAEADRETAKLLNISRGHACLLRGVNDSVDGAPSIVLTDPERVLGDQAGKILDFWAFLDTMTEAQWAATRDAARAAVWVAAGAATWVAAGAATWAAAGAAAGAAARDAARDATWGATWAATWDAAAGAISEIMGARVLSEQERPFYFLPMFGFASPNDIPARAADYGQIAA